MNLKHTLLLFSLFINISLFAQAPEDMIPGEMVVQFESEASFIKYIDQPHPSIQLSKMVSKNLQVYLFKYNPEAVAIQTLSNDLNSHPLIKAAGQNFKMQQRITIPDDEFFSNQRSFDLIQAPEAWDINTSAPPEVVVAVIEGADISHEDLRDNIWNNPHEIPDDGIDNDNNGYIDDYRGVNVTDSTDTPVLDRHGTSVAGVIGATGNNGIGVAGMLWDVKMMIVSSSLTFTEIVESYEYVYAMRKKYNDTNGAEGAYVVSANSSFGVDRRFPNQMDIFGIWCDLYDLLGEVGIVSVAATSNDVINIELEGDMPGMCSSDYLIIVTDTNLDDELDGGFSRNFVDLSAPGRNYTTDSSNGYRYFGGTSAATPVVTGAITMLYSYSCHELQTQVMEQPAQTALQMKRIILESVDLIPELSDKVVSGGRLNIFNAMEQIQTEFGASRGRLEFLNIFPNPVSQKETLFIEYQIPEVSEYDIKIYDALGRWISLDEVPIICAPKYLEVNVTKLAAGTYFISIENNNDISGGRFIVY